MRADDPAFLAFAAVVERAVAPLVPSLAALAGAADRREVSKGDHLLRVGETARHLLFVHVGMLRYYYTDAASGEERTGQFFDEGRVFTDAASFIAQVPSTQSIEALEPGTVLGLPRAAVYAAYTDHALERFGRIMVEEALVGSQRRAANLLTRAPEDRYRQFVTARPEVARRLPQYLIASYCGITPEALSRIRGRLGRKRSA